MSGATGSRRAAAAAARDLAGARDLGVIDRYQQHEIPQVVGDGHPVRPAPGGVRLRADPRRGPARRCPVRAGRVRPEPGRVRGLSDGGALRARAPGGRAAGVADRHRPVGRVRARHAHPHRRAARPGPRPDPRPDHPGVRGVLRRDPAAGSGRAPPAGKSKAERYLLVACTELYTHYLLGDRSLATFTAFVLTELRRSVGDRRARPLPELRVRHEALLLFSGWR